MEIRRFGRSGLEVWRLAPDSMQFGRTAGGRICFAVMDGHQAVGGNFLDTADIDSHGSEGNRGGISEETVGGWIEARGYLHDIVQVALAWLVSSSPVTAPIAGASSVERLRAGPVARELQVGGEEMESFNGLGDRRHR
jgi:aryl-alcohol dehydrogenase-like predicted oxidoreductase